MASREEFPKISVDKIENWNRVASNCRKAGSQVAEALAAEANLSSADRDLVLRYMDEYMNQAFLNSQPNLRVNGHSFASLQSHGDPFAETETFDEALDRRVWSLADTRLQWHKRLAENRRTAPTEIRDSVAQLLEQHRTLDEDNDAALVVPDAEDNAVVEADLDIASLSESVRINTAFAEELAQKSKLCDHEQGAYPKMILGIRPDLHPFHHHQTLHDLHQTHDPRLPPRVPLLVQNPHDHHDPREEVPLFHHGHHVRLLHHVPALDN
ncbi:hypothetical protein MD484_g2753, partial [Candolleomyces efflorescens]